MKDKKFASKYEKNNKKRANIIKQAVRRGVREYAETFKRLAAV